MDIEFNLVSFFVGMIAGVFLSVIFGLLIIHFGK